MHFLAQRANFTVEVVYFFLIRRASLSLASARSSSRADLSCWIIEWSSLLEISSEFWTVVSVCRYTMSCTALTVFSFCWSLAAASSSFSSPWSSASVVPLVNHRTGIGRGKSQPLPRWWACLGWTPKGQFRVLSQRELYSYCLGGHFTFAGNAETLSPDNILGPLFVLQGSQEIGLRRHPARSPGPRLKENCTPKS